MSTPEELWLRVRTEMLGYLRTKLPSAADAEDVLHDVFLRMHTAKTPRSLTPGWAYGIARHAVADFYRARKGQSPVPLSAVDVVDPATAPVHLTDHEGGHDVHEEVLSWMLPLIDELPPEFAQAVRLADVDGLSQAEVAEAAGLSLSGAKSRIQRGRQRLGVLLDQCCAVEFGADGRADAFVRRGTSK